MKQQHAPARSRVSVGAGGFLAILSLVAVLVALQFAALTIFTFIIWNHWLAAEFGKEPIGWGIAFLVACVFTGLKTVLRGSP